MTILLTVAGARSQGSGTTNGTGSYTLSVSPLRGQSAYTLTTAAYTQPAVSSTVTVSVQSSTWLDVGSYVRTSGGDYEVTALPTSTSVTIQNLGYPGAASPGATVASGSSVTATGQRGADGASGATAAWSAATAYTVGMIATLSGVSYVCVLAHTNQTPPNATYWKAAIVEGDSRLSDTRTPTALSVTDASISATAAIAVTKLALGAVNTVLKGGASSNSFAQIVDADISSSAAIALSKLASMPALASRLVSAGTGLTGGGDLSADRTLAVAYGTTGTTACVGNDSRLSDTRTPTDGSVTNAKMVAGTNGQVHVTSGTSVVWATIVNANVSASAAIAGSKINPAFGAQDITGTGRITVCATGTNSGANAAMVGGGGHSISGAATFGGVFSGNGNSVSAAYAVTCGGNGNTAAGSFSFAAGGYSCTATGSSSCIIGSANSSTSAAATNSCVMGSVGGAATMPTQLVHAGGHTATAGERQKSEIIARGDTPGSAANETISLLFGVAAGTPTQAIATQTGRSYAVRILVTCRKASDVTVSGTWEVKGEVINNAGTVSVSAGYIVTLLKTALPAALTGATITLSGSGANLVVTGNTGAGNTVATRWAAAVEWVECA